MATVAMPIQGQTQAQLFGFGDPVIAIDLNGNSGFPSGEAPLNATDQNNSSKYLNSGGRYSGLIVTPNSGPSVIQSIQFTTANDVEERDPASFSIYGTNDPITSADNSFGEQEQWTKIAESPIKLPTERFASSEIVSFANSTTFRSYRLIIESIKSAKPSTAMQFADVRFYTSTLGDGEQILAGGDFSIAVNTNRGGFSSYPPAESATNVIDGTLDKYFNIGRENSGFIVRRSDNVPVIVNGFTITTANDVIERDPASYAIFGTNDTITSAQNSCGEEENWTLVAAGNINLPDERNTVGDAVEFANSKSFSAYRVVFPTVKNNSTNGMQIAEMTFRGEVVDVLPGDVNCDGIINLLDVAPFVEALSSGQYVIKADINQDGLSNLLDVGPFVALLAGS